MFQLVVSYQLIFALAVGPLMCCCTTARLFAAPADKTAAHQLTVTKVQGCSSCCAHKHQPNKSTDDRGRIDHKPVPAKPTEKCPCKGGTCKPATIQSEVTSADAATVLRTLTVANVLPFASVGGTCCLVQAVMDFAYLRGANTAYPSTADLLFAHHNLRC